MVIQFSTIKELAKDNLDLKSQLNGLLKIFPSVILDASHAYDVYSRRADIQKNITQHNLIEGWEKLIPNLEKVSKKKGTNISLIHIIGESFGLIFFINLNNNIILGVLKFLNQKVDPKIELDHNGEIKGTWTNGISFYHKGKQIL